MTDVSKIKTFVSQAGINMLHTEGYYATHTPATWSDYLDQAKAYGLPAIGPARGDYEVPRAYWAPSPVNAGNSITTLIAWPSMSGPIRIILPCLPGPGRMNPIWVEGPEDLHAYIGGMGVCCASRGSSSSDRSIFSMAMTGQGIMALRRISMTILQARRFSAARNGCRMPFHLIITLSRSVCIPSMNFTDMGPYAVYLDALDRIQSSNKYLVPVITRNPCPCRGNATDTKPANYRGTDIPGSLDERDPWCQRNHLVSILRPIVRSDGAQ